MVRLRRIELPYRAVPMTAAATILLLLASGGSGLVGWRWFLEWKRLRRRRARLLRPARRILAECVTTHDGTAFPVCTGLYHDIPVELRTATGRGQARKPSALRLTITLTAPTGAPGILDVMRRTYAEALPPPRHELPLTFPTPANLPQDLLIRGDTEAAGELVPLLARHAELLASPDTTELLVTANGIRVVRHLPHGPGVSASLTPDAELPLPLELEAAALAQTLDAASALLADVTAREESLANAA